MKAQENVFYPMKNKEELYILYTRMIARWSRKHLFQATLFFQSFMLTSRWLTFKPRSGVEILLYLTHASEARRTIVFAIKRFRYIKVGIHPFWAPDWGAFPYIFLLPGRRMSFYTWRTSLSGGPLYQVSSLYHEHKMKKRFVALGNASIMCDILLAK